MSLIAEPSRPVHTAAHERDHAPKGGVGLLALGALGVVFGSVGTSPLYAMDLIVRVAKLQAVEDAIGAASLAIWSLALVVSLQYAVLVLRAQNDGEGGLFALYGLLHDRRDPRARMLLWALIAGAGLLIGDGMITPAISVLSAVEGLGVAAPALSSLVIPVTLGLLIALFAVQFIGASRVGSVFGPDRARLVRRDCGARRGRDRRRAADSRGFRPSVRSPLPGARQLLRDAAIARRPDAGGRRRRSDVRRRRAFRRRAHPDVLVRRRLSGARPQLPRPGRLSVGGAAARATSCSSR